MAIVSLTRQRDTFATCIKWESKWRRLAVTLDCRAAPNVNISTRRTYDTVLSKVVSRARARTRCVNFFFITIWQIGQTGGMSDAAVRCEKYGVAVLRDTNTWFRRRPFDSLQCNNRGLLSSHIYCLIVCVHINIYSKNQTARSRVRTHAHARTHTSRHICVIEYQVCHRRALIVRRELFHFIEDILIFTV